LKRLQNLKKKISDKHFLGKVYTKTEIEYCLNKANPAQHFTARWCAKEAVVKAFYGLGIKSIDYTKIEIINNSEGYPLIGIHDPRCKDFDAKVSLSHSGGMAMATVVIMVH